MSLRQRLLFVIGAIALLVSIATGAATYSAQQRFLYGELDQSLLTAQGRLEQALVQGRPMTLMMVAQFAPGMFVQVRTAFGTVLATVEAESPGSAAASPALPKTLAMSGGLGAAKIWTAPAAGGGAPFRVLGTVLPGGDQLVLAVSLHEVDAILRHLMTIEAILALLLLAIALAVGWWLVDLGLRPLRDVERTAAAIAAGELDRRVAVSDQVTEVGQLARSFNTMLDRIQEAFHRRDETEEQLRRFVADASHELRTPVAAVAAYAELFERGANRRPDDLVRVLAGIRRETSRMASLVEDLLLLAQLDQGRPLEQKPVELVALAAQAAETARLVGPDWPVEVEARRPVEVLGDQKRLRQVMDNLLGNVRSHTPPGTRARIVVKDDGEEAWLTVSDNGPGIPKVHQPHLFQRFYRADPSRSRESGGAGLGLAIVRAIVAAHGGQAEVHSEPGHGTAVIIRLPRLTEADPWD